MHNGSDVAPAYRKRMQSLHHQRHSRSSAIQLNKARKTIGILFKKN